LEMMYTYIGTKGKPWYRTMVESKTFMLHSLLYKRTPFSHTAFL